MEGSVRLIVRTAMSFGNHPAEMAARPWLERPGPSDVGPDGGYPSIRSTTVAIPWPTPMHIVARP